MTDWAERFWSKVDQSGGPDACWEWKASKVKRGYGLFGVRRKLVLAHRFAYEIENGPIPGGLHCLHKCDNPVCVNPRHLFLGTQTDNMRDKEQKGRGNHPRGDRNGARTHPETRRGDRNGRAKLTSAQVTEIRVAYATGGVLQRELAKQFGVSKSAISFVVRGEHWKHLKKENK